MSRATMTRVAEIISTGPIHRRRRSPTGAAGADQGSQWRGLSGLGGTLETVGKVIEWSFGVCGRNAQHHQRATPFASFVSGALSLSARIGRIGPPKEPARQQPAP